MALFFCKECGKQISDKAVTCPHCGSPVAAQFASSYYETPPQNGNTEVTPEPEKSHGCLTFIAIIIILLILNAQRTKGNYAANSSNNTSIQSNAARKQKPDLELLCHQGTSDALSNHIVGQVRNNTNRTLYYVSVEINLYKGNVLVGTTSDIITSLDSGEIWEFKASFFEEDVDNYKITDISDISGY